jgi:hypothetical protein
MKKLSLIVLLLSQLAHAGGGGWVSSGGELFKDAKNPWFVRNTPLVRYCMQVDEPTVSATPRQVRQLISQALSYWQVEFAKATPFGRSTVEVATQRFEEVDCATGLADLAFKIGYGTLNADEIKYLGDPGKYIGVAVRTAYDEEQLRGKGFIYISSDRGPNAYANTGALIEHAWEKEKLLYYALLHETGHVFGLPHTGSGLMSEVFLDQILNKAVYEIFVDSPVESFFYPDSRLELCTLSGPDRAWFGLTMDVECVAMAPSASAGEIEVLARKAGATDWNAVGMLKSIRMNIWDMRNRPAVYLQLNPRQKVFSGEEASFRSFMLGAQFVDYGADAVYVAKSDNLPKSVYLRVTSSSFQVLGQQSGKLRTMFNYNSLIGTKLIINP